MIDEELLFYFGTTSLNELPRYELIKFPRVSNIENLRFTAFNRFYDLYFENNDKLLSPYFRWFVVDDDDYHLKETDRNNCHYLHKESNLIVAFSFCEKNVNGLILHDNTALEIISLNDRLHRILNHDNNEEIINIIKPAFLDVEASNFDDDNHVLIQDNNLPFRRFMRRSSPSYRQVESASNNKLTLEVAVFFDEIAYKTFAPYFEYDTSQMKNMLLAYMNMVQALYYEPSLGIPLDIVLVQLEIFKQQPQDLPHYNGERSLLLDSFCIYNKKHNKPNDDDVNHWDMGLYVSGLDFYAVENGVRSGGTMGLATVGGVCTERYSCIISEFGATNEYGKPYPSAGFSSVYILAHEIGHNLGMHHDGTSNNCPKDGYIMSPSRGVYGETIWSSCSASVMYSLSSTAPCLCEVTSRKTDFDHNKFSLKPGQFWNAKKQCEILLKDVNAFVMNATQDMCTNLMCQSTHKSGFYHAGPALEGTKCDENKWCEDGNCVRMKTIPNLKIVKGGWSDWKNVGCKSACMVKSKGYQKKTRTCTNPAPVNTDEGCKGPAEDVQLCKDEKICKKTKRLNVVDYATFKCQEFSKLLPILEPNGTGIQAPYEEDRLWTACAIFCKRKSSDTFYSPRLDLNDMKVDPYFPDGTWCHTNGKQAYYCLQHLCLPDNDLRRSKNFSPSNSDLYVPQDASFDVNLTPEEIHRYLSVDMNGAPLLTTLKPINDFQPNEWNVDLNTL
ncbi:A disintegrin and metalloproteinase with thrombospondin motifs adt-1-like isoform X2 [Planococcus citri]